MMMDTMTAVTAQLFVASVTDVKSLEGEAQIVSSRGKRRQLFDFRATVEFEVVVGDSDGGGGGDSGKKKKKQQQQTYKGSMELTEISPTAASGPGCCCEGSISFKKSLPSSSVLARKIQETAQLLKAEIILKLNRLFADEFACL